MNYDRINPEQYERMYDLIPREIYMKEHWRPLIEKEIVKYCKDKNVLDLGCGTGTYTTIIKKYTDNVLGIDISKRYLNYLKSKKRFSNIIRADAHNLPLKDGSFDVIVTIGLFEYVDRKIVIKEMNRVLKPGGFCIVSVPNKYSAYRMVGKLFCKIFRREYYPNELSKKEMFMLFENNGFELIEYKMDDGLIWLPNFLDKLIGRKVYDLMENFFKIFGRNPFSNVMLFIAKKVESCGGEKMKKLLRVAITGIRGSGFRKEYHEIKNINSKDELSEFQKKYLTKLLLHAYKNVPYYHEIFDKISIIRNGKVDLSKFDQIPILTKEIIRKRYKDLISKDYTTRKWYYNSSGGSTGEPVRFIQDDLYAGWKNAVIYYFAKLGLFLSRFLFSCSLESLMSRGAGRS